MPVDDTLPGRGGSLWGQIVVLLPRGSMAAYVLRRTTRFYIDDKTTLSSATHVIA